MKSLLFFTTSIFLVLAFICSLSLLSPAYAQNNPSEEILVGTLVEAEGKVFLQRGSSFPKSITIGTPIHLNDIIITDTVARALIMLTDNTEIILSDDAVFKIDTYAFDPDAPQSNKGRFSFLRGAFLFVSGIITKNDSPDVTLETPIGSIGIRGTTVWGGFIEDKFGVLVGDGEVTVQTDRGRVQLKENEGTFAKDKNSMPSLPKMWGQPKIDFAMNAIALQNRSEVDRRIKMIKTEYPDVRKRTEAFKNLDLMNLPPEVQPVPETPPAQAPAQPQSEPQELKKSSVERPRTKQRISRAIKDDPVQTPPAETYRSRRSVSPSLSTPTKTAPIETTPDEMAPAKTTPVKPQPAVQTKIVETVPTVAPKMAPTDPAPAAQPKTTARTIPAAAPPNQATAAPQELKRAAPAAIEKHMKRAPPASAPQPQPQPQPSVPPAPQPKLQQPIQKTVQTQAEPQTPPQTELPKEMKAAPQATPKVQAQTPASINRANAERLLDKKPSKLQVPQAKSPEPAQSAAVATQDPTLPTDFDQKQKEIEKNLEERRAEIIKNSDDLREKQNKEIAMRRKRVYQAKVLELERQGYNPAQIHEIMERSHLKSE